MTTILNLSANARHPEKMSSMVTAMFTFTKSNRLDNIIDAHISNVFHCCYENNLLSQNNVYAKTCSFGNDKRIEFNVFKRIYHQRYHWQRLYLQRIRCHLLYWSRSVHLIYDSYSVCSRFHLFNLISPFLHRVHWH